MGFLSEMNPNNPSEGTSASRTLQPRNVVAYPRGRPEQPDDSMALLTKPRPRSLSSGRNRNRSTDLVQNVYDRLGVRRGEWILTNNSSTTTTAAASTEPNLVDDETLDPILGHSSSMENSLGNATNSPVRRNTIAQPYGNNNNGNNNVTSGSGNRSSYFNNTASTLPRTSSATNNHGPKNQKDEGTNNRNISTSAFHERFLAAANKTRTGGRPAEKPEVPEARITRSLSRSRVMERWPPASSDQVDAPPVADKKQTPTSPRFGGDGFRNSFQGLQHQQTTASVARLPAKPSLPLSGVTKKNPPPPLTLTNTTTTVNTNAQPHQQQSQQPSKNAEDPSESNLTESSSSYSVKDRLRAYGGSVGNAKGAPSATGISGGNKSKPKTNTVQKKAMAPTANQPPARDRPPKIDIYEKPKQLDMDVDEKKEDETTLPAQTTLGEVEVTTNPVRKSFAPTYLTVAGTETAGSLRRSIASKPGAGKVGNHQFVTPVGTTRSQPNRPSFAAKGLVGSQPSSNVTTTAPLTEIAASDENALDSGSVAMSSVSGTEDFPVQEDQPKKASTAVWQTRNRLRPTPCGGPTAPPVLTPNPPVTTGTTAAVGATALDPVIAKLVDERVQAHIADLETKLGAQMRRWMQQMDDKMLMRMEAMEGQLRAMQMKLDQLTR